MSSLASNAFELMLFSLLTLLTLYLCICSFSLFLNSHALALFLCHLSKHDLSFSTTTLPKIARRSAAERLSRHTHSRDRLTEFLFFYRANDISLLLSCSVSCVCVRAIITFTGTVHNQWIIDSINRQSCSVADTASTIITTVKTTTTTTTRTGTTQHT